MAITIEETKVRTLTITGGDNGDPITLFVNDIASGKGSVTIKCYDSAWTAYWGGMGDRTVLEYIAQAELYNLVKYLCSNDTEQVDNDKIIEMMTDFVKGQVESGQIDVETCEVIIDELEGYEYECHADEQPNEWLEEDWHYNLPMKPSKEWAWLEAIMIDVQNSLRVYNEKEIQEC